MFRYGDYKFVVATSEDLLRQVQRLRYRVYVKECGFENPEDHPDGMEKDPFDPLPGEYREESASQGKRTQSVMMVGLIALVYQVSIQLGLSQWIMVSEKKLWLALKRLGLFFKQIGPPMEYHGVRIPYLASISDNDRGIQKIHFDMLNQFNEAHEIGGRSGSSTLLQKGEN